MAEWAGEWRALVTGSRRWTDRATLYDVLDEQLREAMRQNVDLVVIHGDNPNGADRIAKDWYGLMREIWTIREEPYPADWRTHRKAAGVIRNAQMVATGANVCLAFPLSDSRGTVDCMDRARVAGIEVVMYAPSIHPDERSTA